MGSEFSEPASRPAWFPIAGDAATRPPHRFVTDPLSVQWTSATTLPPLESTTHPPIHPPMAGQFTSPPAIGNHLLIARWGDAVDSLRSVHVAVEASSRVSEVSAGIRIHLHDFQRRLLLFCGFERVTLNRTGGPCSSSSSTLLRFLLLSARRFLPASTIETICRPPEKKVD